MSSCLADKCFIACEPEFAWLEPKRNGWQFGEQGLIDAIVDRIKPALKVAVEIGAGDGGDLPLTCGRLLDRGWKVIAYEIDEASRSKLLANYPELAIREEYLFNAIPDCSVLVIDIDGADSVAMATALESCVPNLVVVEHYDFEGPHMAAGRHSFDEPIPEWLLGMPLGIPQAPGFIIQSHAAHLDTIAEAYGLAPVCKTRVNSFYVPHRIAEELRNV